MKINEANDATVELENAGAIPAPASNFFITTTTTANFSVASSMVNDYALYLDAIGREGCKATIAELRPIPRP
jgi:hypothetical protein